VLSVIAQAHQASQKQVALAWLLRRSPIMLPIPGTSSVEHLEENVAAASVELTEEEYKRLAAVPELAPHRELWQTPSSASPKGQKWNEKT
jgi:aryl-alcohol dehydrogenase-like predicted oxidoreductase